MSKQGSCGGHGRSLPLESTVTTLPICLTVYHKRGAGTRGEFCADPTGFCRDLRTVHLGADRQVRDLPGAGGYRKRMWCVLLVLGRGRDTHGQGGSLSYVQLVRNCNWWPTSLFGIDEALTREQCDLPLERQVVARAQGWL